MAVRRDLPTRCKTTLYSQKSRAKKYGAVVAYTADDLVSIVPPRCPYCDRKITPATLNFDHRESVGRGGAWTLENLAAICGSCNRRKGALSENEYNLLLLSLDEIVGRVGDTFIKTNVLARLAAGGAYIHG